MEGFAADIHVMPMDLTAITAMAEAERPDTRVLPLLRLVESYDTAVPPGKHKETVRLEQRPLGSAVHLIMKSDHTDNVVPPPGSAPAVFVGAIRTGTFVMIGKDQRQAPITAENIGIREKLVLRVQQLPAETVIVRPGDIKKHPKTASAALAQLSYRGYARQIT